MSAENLPLLWLYSWQWQALFMYRSVPACVAAPAAAQSARSVHLPLIRKHPSVAITLN